MAHTISQGDEPQESETTGDEKILEEAFARLKLAEEAETDTRRLFLEDLEFRAGKQWPDDIVAARQRDGRPCLVINRMPQFIQQVTNDQRQNRPSIKVHPVDDKGDIDTGKVIQGIIRHIEYNSNADVAYDTAFESAAIGGLGYFRVTTDYVSHTSFDQEILIKRVRNPMSVRFDPYSQEPDGSDANFAFIVEDLSKDEYKARFPKSKLSAPGEWEAVGNSKPDWITKDSARVAEYFYKELEEKTLYMLSTGEGVIKEELETIAAKYAAQGVAVEIVNERQTMVPVVKWCKISGTEILEKTVWLGLWIPIVPVYGTELYIDGKRVLEGIVRNAKDSQRMLNYWKSAETEAIALAPRAPWIAAEGQLDGHEEAWATANTRNHSVLKYKPKSVDGQLVGPPQRNTFEPAIGAITQASMGAADDLKATTGIYDASLGGRSNETSGVAIQRRNQQAQTSNFHFIDNLTRSLRHTGRILVDLIPKIYDTARAARIVGEDGEQRVVQVNGPGQDNGKETLYALDAGKYDATVDVGPSFASKRQEATQAMIEMTKSIPSIGQAAPDLIVKSMDWHGAQELAERLKKTLPPNLTDDPNKAAPAVPPQMQAQMEQMGQMVEQLTQQLHQAEDDADKKRLELESRERIEMKKLEVQLEIERAKLDQEHSLELFSAEIAQLNARQEQLRGFEPIEDLSPEQDPAMPAPGAPGAEMGGMPEDPTGGESPGQPMEGPPIQ